MLKIQVMAFDLLLELIFESDDNEILAHILAIRLATSSAFFSEWNFASSTPTHLL